MKRLKASVAALGVAAMVGAAAPALAQQPAPAPANITLTAAERTALLPVKQAVDARNWTLASSLVPAARSAARSDNARYVLGRLELEIAIGTQNRAAQFQAITNVLETRKSSVEEQVELLRQYAGIAYDQGNLNAADATLNRALQLAPNDPETLSMLAQLNRNRNNPTQALSFFQRAARAAEAAGRSLPESRYRLALALAEQAGQRGVALEIARQFIATYPTPQNWRDVLIVYRTVAEPSRPPSQAVDAAQNLDALRLMRASGALSGERDYMALATALSEAGYHAEAKAVVEEGTARRMLTASDSAPRQLITAANPRITRERAALAGQLTQARAAAATATQTRTVADTLLAHGRDAEAAELYRLALTRAGEDPGLVNTRLGIALARAGQRAEAEAAFRAVTGPRADLAALWAIWAARSGS